MFTQNTYRHMWRLAKRLDIADLKWISLTFYACVFCTQVLPATFLCYILAL